MALQLSMAGAGKRKRWIQIPQFTTSKTVLLTATDVFRIFNKEQSSGAMDTTDDATVPTTSAPPASSAAAATSAAPASSAASSAPAAASGGAVDIEVRFFLPYEKTDSFSCWRPSLPYLPLVKSPLTFSRLVLSPQALNDPAFLGSLLSQLPGVDPNDPEIQTMLSSFAANQQQAKDKPKDDKDKEKK